MSFNTFCGQDPANAATYQRVLLRFQEGGGGGGIAAVNAGVNIDIPNPAVPVVALQNPLTAPLNLGNVDVLDTAGAMGAAGTFLQSLGAGAGTNWAVGGGGIAVVAAGTNISVPNPAVPVVALANPLTAALNLGAVDVLATVGGAGAAGQILSSQGAGAGTSWIAAGGGGIAAVNAGTNISIPNPAVPVVALANPLTAPLNLGNVDVLDTAGAMGAAGTFLQSLGAGAGTNWAVGGGGIAAVNAGTNISIPNPAVPVVALANPLTSALNLGAVDVLDTAGAMGAVGTVLSSLGAGVGTSWTANGVANVAAGTNISIPNPAVPVVALANPLTSTLAMGAVGISDSVASTGGAGDVLTCGAGNTTLWAPSASSTNYPVAFVSYFNEIALPATSLPINDGNAGLYTTADLIRGNIAPTVSLMYDPVAAAAEPLITPNTVEVEIHLEMVNLKNQFAIGLPSAQLLNDNNNIINGIIVGGVSCPTALVYRWTYEINGVPAPQDFAVPQFYSSIYTEVPAVLCAIYPYGPQAFSTQFSGRTLLDLTGALATDIYSFQLWAYTQDNGLGPIKVVDTASITSFGVVSIKTSMVRL